MTRFEDDGAQSSVPEDVMRHVCRVPPWCTYMK
jgi:hypothetical protein